ncbi:hypothetical protein ACWHA1_41145, partial [Streptomyces decoyicus]
PHGAVIRALGPVLILVPVPQHRPAATRAAHRRLGAVLPVLGVAVIAACIPCYGLPLAGEIAKAKRRRARGHQR